VKDLLTATVLIIASYAVTLPSIPKVPELPEEPEKLEAADYTAVTFRRR
tara:strand:+ start:6347 stop:6493 length:147 start_codon:yes stop_codon:yes gene_type:complete